MRGHSVDRLIDDLNGFNEEAEQLIDEIEYIIIEEKKIDDIDNEDIHYDG